MSNIDLKEFFMDLSIEGFFNDKLNLGADAMLSNKDISDYQLPPIDRTIHIYIKNIGRDNDIVLGEKYNVVYLRQDPKNYKKTECEIDFVSLKKNDNIGVIPRGYGGCVRLKFKYGIPDVINLLMQDNDEKFDKEKHQYLYFTTQEVIDEILAELDKAENV